MIHEQCKLHHLQSFRCTVLVALSLCVAFLWHSLGRREKCVRGHATIVHTETHFNLGERPFAIQTEIKNFRRECRWLFAMLRSHILQSHAAAAAPGGAFVGTVVVVSVNIHYHYMM